MPASDGLPPSLLRPRGAKLSDVLIGSWAAKALRERYTDAGPAFTAYLISSAMPWTSGLLGRSHPRQTEKGRTLATRMKSASALSMTRSCRIQSWARRASIVAT